MNRHPISKRLETTTTCTTPSRPLAPRHPPLALPAPPPWRWAPGPTLVQPALHPPLVLHITLSTPTSSLQEAPTMRRLVLSGATSTRSPWLAHPPRPLVHPSRWHTTPLDHTLSRAHSRTTDHHTTTFSSRREPAVVCILPSPG